MQGWGLGRDTHYQSLFLSQVDWRLCPQWSSAGFLLQKEDELPCSPPVKLHLLNTFLYVQYRDDERTRGLCLVLGGQGRPHPRPHVHGALLLSPGPGWYRWLKAPPEPCWASPQQVLKGYGTACTLGGPGLCTWRWRSRAPARWGWWRKTGGKVLKTKTEQQGDWVAKLSNWRVNGIWAGRRNLLQEPATWWDSWSFWWKANILLSWLCLIDSLCLFLGAVANERNI